MKKYIKELIVIAFQLCVFYIVPLFNRTNDAIGMVLLIILLTFALSLIRGIINDSKLKYIYPVLISILFIPTVFMYYNESAMIHIIWYLIVSSLGVLVGALFRKMITHK